MTQTSVTPAYTIGPDEKSAQVMIYTQSALIWGDVVVKQIIRVSTWPRTNTVPERICIYNAKVMQTNGSTLTKPLQFSELHQSLSQIWGFHLTPPARDPIDYDPTEPNRRMQPISMLMGSFRIDGNLRLAGKSTLAKFLEVTREAFTAIYDAKITNTNLLSLGMISTPFMLVRQETTVFTLP